MAPKHDSEPLGVENCTDILIVLLYAPGKSDKPNEPIDGITRLQKLMFLLQQGEGPKQLVSDALAYGYKPYKMGPYAPELQRDLNDLQSAGIIHTQRLDFWLPDDGTRPRGRSQRSSQQQERNESSRFDFRSRPILDCRLAVIFGRHSAQNSRTPCHNSRSSSTH